MDTTFLSYLLTFLLAVILVVYLYQITEGDNNKKIQSDTNSNLLVMKYDKKKNNVYNMNYIH